MPVKTEDGNAIMIPINEIRAFKTHPFKVADDEAMEMLKDSIKTQGILNDYIESDCKVNAELIHKLIDCEMNGREILEVLEESDRKNIPTRVRVNISKKIINKYFPDTMSDKEIEEIIEMLLADWKKKQQ